MQEIRARVGLRRVVIWETEIGLGIQDVVDNEVPCLIIGGISYISMRETPS